MAETSLTADRLREVLDYCPETGIFRRRPGPHTLEKSGKPVGNLTGNGYLKVLVDGKHYRAHRLAWLYVYGEFPSVDLDHINRIGLDNRIANLRLASDSENNQNRSMQRNNRSGYRGVHWNARDKCWHAQIQVNKKIRHLGSYRDPEAAYAAYCAAAAELHTCNPFARAAKEGASNAR